MNGLSVKGDQMEEPWGSQGSLRGVTMCLQAGDQWVFISCQVKMRHHTPPSSILGSGWISHDSHACQETLHLQKTTPRFGNHLMFYSHLLKRKQSSLEQTQWTLFIRTIEMRIKSLWLENFACVVVGNSLHNSYWPSHFSLSHLKLQFFLCLILGLFLNADEKLKK